ncbi:HAD hydrolase-like protein [Photobacterium carnosum]|uniref:HAD hydrolase-like protein n=1 Tax=Photobacterium carnosum TaxID=2023717 RepID=UPI001F393C6A|nr:HAD hydrolase-like protein [Photobacterium carnosum]MCF2155744.1 HAD hydrolase-like protein [Photobacterium carnosum]MCF2217575.1 HAD hydrolase-like protein [Photobacterium carnosum]
MINELTLTDNIEFIFTDFFDTVVSRKCHPEEIKRKWCKNVIEMYDIDLATEELYNLRINIEAELCYVNNELYSEIEFKYIDLCSRLSNILDITCEDSKSLYSSFLDIELEIEKNNQYLNDDVISFLKKQKKQNKKIYLVSDFYLSDTSISKLIEYHGLDGVFDEIFVSSTLMKTKRSGSLYKHITDKENIDPKSVFMIGDNHYNDIVMSNSNGIHAHHIIRDFSLYNQSLSNDKNIKIIKNEYRKILKVNSGIFSWMSIPLFFFIKKLYLKLKKNKVKNVIFLAREGEFLKELFDLYLVYRGDESIQTHYMYASRRGTYLPSLFELNEDTFDKVLNQYPTISLTTLLNSLGLSKYIDGLKKEIKNVEFENVHLNLKLSDDFKNLLKNDIFKELFQKESEIRRKHLSDYMNSLIANEDIHLVDVGWKGSIQDNIQSALNRKVCGYYCGILPNAKITSENVKSGLLFEYINNKCLGDPIFNEFRASFEVFCAASHGSLIRYVDGPIFGDLEDNPYELQLYRDKIRPIQINIKNVITAYCKLENKYSISFLDIQRILKPIYKRNILIPSSIEIDEFSSYKHYENFGVFNYSSFNSESSRVLYLKSLIKNPHLTLAKEWWKPMGFRNNGFSILKYPYYLIYSLFKKSNN